MPAVCPRADDPDPVERVVPIVPREHDDGLRSGRRRRREDRDVELAVQPQLRPGRDPVRPRSERDGAPFGNDIDPRLCRPVHRVRELSRELREAVRALSVAAGCDLERAAPVGEDDGMSHRVLVEPDRIQPGRERQDRRRRAGRGQRDEHRPQRRAVRREGEHDQDAHESDLRGEAPSAHHDRRP